jgi:DNA helicase HerA-like ATPase
MIMPNRPRIPKNVETAIFVECGHRCAVCGTPFPLERAHIIPWHKTKEHKQEDLICLCANCHERADSGEWGEAALRSYKQNPWVKRYDKTDNIPTPTTKIQIKIDIEVEHLDEKTQNWLVHGLAGFLEISPNAVKIISKEKGSVLVTVELPRDSADKLLDAYERNDPELAAYLAPLVILDIRTKAKQYVGTIVGESTSQGFRLAIAQEAIREQDIIAVDAELREADNGHNKRKKVRVWAKVQRIERMNPLFPAEAGHELAATKTDPLDTVLSFSREMVTALCQILGAESLSNGFRGKLEHLRYPPQPASSAYRPDKDDIARIVLGDLKKNQKRALDIATLSNRPEIDVLVDGHAIVTRHLAILAMTGAGKSWTARRIIEQLASKEYPIVIFDPHGDYTGLAQVPELKARVRRYYAQFPIFEQAAETVITVVESLGWNLANTHRSMFDDLFKGATAFISAQEALDTRTAWLSNYLGNENIVRYGLMPNLFFLADFVQAVVKAGKGSDSEALNQIVEWSGRNELKINKQTAGWLEGLPNNLRAAARRLKQMEDISKRVAQTSEPLPTDRTQLVRYGGISIVALAGYTSDFQATIYSLVADGIFTARVSNDLQLPVLLLLEEAHNFAPARANTPSEQRSINTTKQIAQEGRKFGVGLILISQRPSRLDETTLSQCNSYVIMRMVNPADQNYVRRVIETLGEDEARMLPDLDVGEAILSGQLINFPVLVRIKEPESKGEREEVDAFEALEMAKQSSQASVRR